MPDIRAVMRKLEQTVDYLIDVIIQFADGEACHYDHNGGCQTHTIHQDPCPYGIANEMANNEG
jgi:hypothetical protein